MENLFNDLNLRVFTSNLLGQSSYLVLHGGGNTSVKIDDLLYVKGSGWDLVSIKKEGFAPVKLEALKQMAKQDSLSDSDMVRLQREAMTDKSAPNPSVEAILHAIIPFKFVDHTHADSIVTITNSKDGKEIIDKLFPNFLKVPYVMPGFILAKTVYEMSKSLDWGSCEGIILENHGIFTFDDDAKKSYTKMINAVSEAEEFLEKNTNLNPIDIKPKEFDISKLKNLLEKEKGYEIKTVLNNSSLALNYSKLSFENLTRGVLTPEHIIRTKRVPLVIKNGDDIEKNLLKYIKDYQEYFNTFKKDEIMLNPAPNYAVIEDVGVISFGKSEKEANIINDIITHTMEAVFRADCLGGYESISLKDSFDMEYWELEQAKLRSK